MNKQHDPLSANIQNVDFARGYEEWTMAHESEVELKWSHDLA